MKTVGIAIARMGSTRLPGKVLMPLRERPVIEWVVNALSYTTCDDIVVATSTLPADDAIADWCADSEVDCFRGDESDVLARVYGAAQKHNADVVVRVTADCPFLDYLVIEQVIQLRHLTNADYASNVDPPTWPDGLDVEAFTFAALEAAHLEATRPTDRETVTRYIARNRSRFKSETLICPLPGMHKERWVLDTEDDLLFCRAILEQEYPLNYTAILNILNKNPHLRAINRHHPRNERFYDAVAVEELPAQDHSRSRRQLEVARRHIPLGSQTFSKSFVQYPAGTSPLFVTHGDGAYCFDVDGNDYVDLVSGLMPVILGYRDPDVDTAIRRQLSNGITFSLATELEAELAELICRLVPCAEQVRFGKGGSDATAAAVRLARAYTGREQIYLSGYHGWHDWSIGTTERSLGVPPMECYSFVYGQEHKFMPESAAIVVEPDDNPEYLRWLRDYCTKNGIVLIFDEVITGFRWSLGGAQEFWGVTPDLACFGKAMANGMPISAVAGKRDIMRLMEPAPLRDNIFYSGTTFGETLSIAAAIATIKKLEANQIPTILALTGTTLVTLVTQYIKQYNLKTILEIYGHGARKRLRWLGKFADELKTLFMREMIRRGVLIIDSHNLTASHGPAEIQRILKAYDETLSFISSVVAGGEIRGALGNTPVIGPVSVRAYERPERVD